jgi:plasmid stabilization system protein ParE
VKLNVSQAAQADLLRLHAFLADKNPDAARRAVASIAGAIDSLDLFPERGRPSSVAGARELIVPFGDSTYLVRYAHDAARDELVILRVWHSRESRE